MTNEDLNWDKVGFYVVEEIKRLNENDKEILHELKKTSSCISKMLIEITKIQTQQKMKNAIWGAIGGAMMSSIVMVSFDIVHAYFTGK